MSIADKSMEALREIIALGERIKDVSKSIDRLEDRVNGFVDRLARVEVQYQNLSRTVSAEVAAQVKTEAALAVKAIEDFRRDFAEIRDGGHPSGTDPAGARDRIAERAG